MSAEFRETGCGFLHEVLGRIEEDGEHEVSRALAALYRALAPLEFDCAMTEARDNGRSRPYIGLVSAMHGIKSAMSKLEQIEEMVREVQEDAVDKLDG